MEEAQTRFALLFPPHTAQNMAVAIVGCGAVGAAVGVFLAKLGIKKFELYDSDSVEPENIGVQIFDQTHLGQTKVVALTEMLVLNGGIDVRVRARDYPVRRGWAVAPWASIPNQVLVASVDNIPTRRLLYNKLRESVRAIYPSVNYLFIDPRMGPTAFEINATGLGACKRTMRGWVRKNYEKKFYENAAPAPCGAAALPTTALMCAARVCNVIKLWAMDQDFPAWEFVDCDTMAVYKGSILTGVHKRRAANSSVLSRRVSA